MRSPADKALGCTADMGTYEAAGYIITETEFATWTDTGPALAGHRADHHRGSACRGRRRAHRRDDADRPPSATPKPSACLTRSSGSSASPGIPVSWPGTQCTSRHRPPCPAWTGNSARAQPDRSALRHLPCHRSSSQVKPDRARTRKPRYGRYLFSGCHSADERALACPTSPPVSGRSQTLGLRR